jgi:Transcriptional regulatory protein, C terminal
MLPDQAPQDVFDRLRRLPFVEVGAEGLVLHDSVRETVGALLRASDPERQLAHRKGAWQQLRREVRQAEPRHHWRYTADMIYLVDHPVVHEAFFPSGASAFHVDPARPEDGEAILAVAAANPAVAAPALVETWWRLLPEAFSVARETGGAVVGFSTVARSAEVPALVFQTDPVAAALRAHLREHSLPGGQVALFSRFCAGRDGELYPSAQTAPLGLDIKRSYLELRPQLRRVYTQVIEIETALPGVAPLGFVHAPIDVMVEGVVNGTMINDLGPASIDGWLSDVVGRELRAADDAGPLDAARRQLVLDGERVDLTTLEWELLQYLHERAGEAVRRESLLADVWGYDWAGGSNVVDVAIRGLRRKLGDRAGALETVRGVGYRLQALS